MDDILGFPVGATAGGEFTAICKYDARAGRIFRIERINTGNGYVSEPVDITPIFKAVVDLTTCNQAGYFFRLRRAFTGASAAGGAGSKVDPTAGATFRQP